MVKAAVDNFGRIDGVVNNAGNLRDMFFHKMGPDDFRAVIDGIANSAADLISRLQQQTSVKVDLAPAAQRQRATRARRSSASAAAPSRGRRRGALRARGSENTGNEGAGSPSPEPAASEAGHFPTKRGSGTKPTPRMLAFARSLAKRKSILLPRECEQSFDNCRAFLELHAGDSGNKSGTSDRKHST